MKYILIALALYPAAALAEWDELNDLPSPPGAELTPTGSPQPTRSPQGEATERKLEGELDRKEGEIKGVINQDMQRNTTKSSNSMGPR